jgi:hypothetical protein
MHHRTPLLIAVLIVVLMIGVPTTWTPRSAVSQEATVFPAPSPIATRCPPCQYVPLIRREFVPITPFPTTPEPTAPPAATAAATPFTTPQPAPLLHVRNYRMYRPPSTSNDLNVIGELENETPYVGHFARVIAKFYDAREAFVATQSTDAVFARTDPGMRNPFLLVLTNAPADITRIEFIVTAHNSGAADYRSAVVLSQLTRDNFGVEVFGEVQNTQADSLSSILLMVTFYDEAGAVYDLVRGYVDISPLALNAISTYKIQTYRADLVGLAYLVQVQGYAVALTPPSTFPTATVQPAVPTPSPAQANPTLLPVSVRTPRSVVGAAQFCPS